MIPVRLSYQYDFHTGTTFMPVRLSHRYDFHASKTFIPVWVQPGSYCGSIFVYMTPVWNFIPVRVIPLRVQPSSYCGSIFVYMTPVWNFIPVRVIPLRVHPGSCTGTTWSLADTTWESWQSEIVPCWDCPDHAYWPFVPTVFIHRAQIAPWQISCWARSAVAWLIRQGGFRIILFIE